MSSSLSKLAHVVNETAMPSNHWPPILLVHAAAGIFCAGLDMVAWEISCDPEEGGESCR